MSDSDDYFKKLRQQVEAGSARGRKLKTVLNACGFERRSKQRIEELNASLSRARLVADPPIAMSTGVETFIRFQLAEESTKAQTRAAGVTIGNLGVTPPEIRKVKQAAKTLEEDQKLDPAIRSVLASAVAGLEVLEAIAKGQSEEDVLPTARQILQTCYDFFARLAKSATKYHQLVPFAAALADLLDKIPF